MRKWGKEDGIFLFEVTCSLSVSKVRENNIEDKVSKISLSLIVVGFCAAVNTDSQDTYTTFPALPPHAINFYSLPQKHLLYIWHKGEAKGGCSRNDVISNNVIVRTGK